MLVEKSWVSHNWGLTRSVPSQVPENEESALEMPLKSRFLPAGIG